MHLLSYPLSQFQCKNIFVLQGDENQLVDPRVIHVMLAEEEVMLLYSVTLLGYASWYTEKYVKPVNPHCCSVYFSWVRTGGKGKMVKL